MTKTKTSVLLLTLVAGIIYLAGCSKSATTTGSSSIVGTWTQNHEHQVTKNNGTTILDTTTNTSFNLQLTADGRFIGPQYTTGYSVSGTKLTVYQPGSSTTVYFSADILTLDAHNFTYQIVDSSYYPDIDYDSHIFTR